jgi:hypothetical protein
MNGQIHELELQHAYNQGYIDALRELARHRPPTAVDDSEMRAAMNAATA